jgi:hypothetical protein
MMSLPGERSQKEGSPIGLTAAFERTPRRGESWSLGVPDWRRGFLRSTVLGWFKSKDPMVEFL